MAGNQIRLILEGQASLAPSTTAVYLQIFNRNLPGWQMADWDNTSPADTDFVLTAQYLDLTDYKDSHDTIVCRVYQQGDTTLRVDLWGPTPDIISASISLSPSASISASVSPSLSPSISPSLSPSASLSESLSPSFSHLFHRRFRLRLAPRDLQAERFDFCFPLSLQHRFLPAYGSISPKQVGINFTFPIAASISGSFLSSFGLYFLIAKPA